MAKLEILHSLQIDIDKGIYLVNGRDISKSGKELHLDFEDGQWSLIVTEDSIYSSTHVARE